MVDLANVDDTSELAKPISTATHRARDAKLDKSNLGEIPNSTSRLFDLNSAKFKAVHAL